jgi:hypothetical protein
MDMIRHKAIAMNVGPIPLCPVLQKHEKAVAVAFIEKDILPSVSAKDYMINRANVM